MSSYFLFAIEFKLLYTENIKYFKLPHPNSRHCIYYNRYIRVNKRMIALNIY